MIERTAGGSVKPNSGGNLGSKRESRVKRR